MKTGNKHPYESIKSNPKWAGTDQARMKPMINSIIFTAKIAICWHHWVNIFMNKLSKWIPYPFHNNFHRKLLCFGGKSEDHIRFQEKEPMSSLGSIMRGRGTDVG
jgi:hypothetical protein